MIDTIAPVAVDAMGGDQAPGAIVQGAVNAARKGRPVILVGTEGRVREELRRLRAAALPIQIRNASEIVEMHEHPGQAMRRKKDNSIRVCFELVAAGSASAMVSAGNSGAVMAGAMFVLGRPPGVERPAIITPLPSLRGSPTIMLDMGAVVDAKPIHLVQFALMGETYSRRVFGVSRPRVAILSNGEEHSKGTDLTRTAAAALRRASIHFVGYCEGRDLLTGEFDVIATDGFTGNVALKAMEGTARVIGEFLRREFLSSVVTKLGALLSRPALDAMKRRMDWREIGGAPLVGVNGVAVISHGRSDALAIENAIRRAGDAACTHFTEEIAQAVAPTESLLAQAAAAAPADGDADRARAPSPRV